MKNFKKLFSLMLVLALVITTVAVNKPAKQIDAAETNTLNCNFENMSSVNTTSTAKSTKAGYWSSEKGSTTHISQFKIYKEESGDFSNGKSGNKCLKAYVTNGRYTTTFYYGFSGASSSKGLSFKVTTSGTPNIKLSAVKVNGKEVLGEKALEKYKWNSFTTSSIGSSSGYVEFDFYCEGGAKENRIYIDDMKQESSSSGSTTVTPKPTSPATTSTPSTKKLNFSYLPGYRCGNDAYKKIDYSTLTHVCLAFFNPADSNSSSFVDSFSKYANYTKVKDFLQNEKKVKVLASFGGGSSDKALYESIGSSSSKRNDFAKNAVKFVIDNGFDGIDLDIEVSSSKCHDFIKYYCDIVAEMRNQIKSQCAAKGIKEILLTTAVAPWVSDGYRASGSYVVDKGKYAFQFFDYVLMMSYDEKHSGNSSIPNHSTYQDAVDMTEHYINKVGVSASKLVLGVPFYARIANYANEDDEIGYNEIVAHSTSDADRDSNKEGHTYTKGSKSEYKPAGFWHYNGKSTIAKKTQYAISKGLAGMMSWDLGQDTLDASTSLNRVIADNLYGTGKSAPRS